MRGSDPHFFKATRDPRSSNVRLNAQVRVRLLAPKCETHIQSVPERDSRVLTTQCKARILKQIVPKREGKTRFQPQMAKIKAEKVLILKDSRLVL